MAKKATAKKTKANPAGKIVPGPYYMVTSQVTYSDGSPARVGTSNGVVTPIIKAATAVENTLDAILCSPPGTWERGAYAIALKSNANALASTVKRYFSPKIQPCEVELTQLMWLTLEQNAACRSLYRCSLALVSDGPTNEIATTLRAHLKLLKASLEPNAEATGDLDKLTDLQREIVQALERHQQPAKRDKIYELVPAGESTINGALASLTKQKILVNRRGKGYCLPTWEV